MSLPRKLMIDGEQIVATTRTHIKVLFIPFIILLVVAGVGGFAINAVGGSGSGVPRWIVVAVMLVLIVWGSVLPFLKWLSWTYTLTNKRILEQKGPLTRINDVAFEKNLNDRILGCGTLIIHDASEQAGLELNDIPHIEAFHRTVTNLVFEKHDKTASDESV